MLVEAANKLQCGQWVGCHRAPCLQLVLGTAGFETATKKSWKHLEWHEVATNNVWWAGAVQPNAACVVVHSSPTIESPLCGLIPCISSPLLDKRINKRAFAFLRSPAVRPGTTTKHIHRKRQQCRGVGVGLQNHRRKKIPHTGTQSSHLKFTDRAVSGGEQERLKMWHRALCVCLRKQRGDVPDKERLPTLRSYLIRHQSFPLRPARIQVNYLDLDRICSSARKWLFSAPSEDCPFWITWYYFVASFLGHTGYPLQAPTAFCALVCPARAARHFCVEIQRCLIINPCVK